MTLTNSSLRSSSKVETALLHMGPEFKASHIPNIHTLKARDAPPTKSQKPLFGACVFIVMDSGGYFFVIIQRVGSIPHMGTTRDSCRYIKAILTPYLATI